MDFETRRFMRQAGKFPGNNADHWPLGVGSEAKRNTAPDSYSTNGGHKLFVFPGYGVNPARNIGADLEPIPITPVKKQNWPEMQIQLKNGWSDTNWGAKMPGDNYLRLLTSSNERARNYLTPGPRGVALGNQVIGPSPLNVMAMAQRGPGAQPSNPGGPGDAGGFTNGGYYG